MGHGRVRCGRRVRRLGYPEATPWLHPLLRWSGSVCQPTSYHRLQVRSSSHLVLCESNRDVLCIEASLDPALSDLCEDALDLVGELGCGARTIQTERDIRKRWHTTRTVDLLCNKQTGVWGVQRLCVVGSDQDSVPVGWFFGRRRIGVGLGLAEMLATGRCAFFIAQTGGLTTAIDGNSIHISWWSSGTGSFGSLGT